MVLKWAMSKRVLISLFLENMEAGANLIWMVRISMQDFQILKKIQLLWMKGMQ